MTLTENAVLLIVLVCLSAFFSGVETAFTSLSEIRLQHLLEKKTKGARKIAALFSNKERLIITILIGNNLVNIAASSLATSMAIEYLGSMGVGVAVGIMTLTILVFGEVTPKTIAIAKNEWIAANSAGLVRFCQFLFFPAIIFLQWMSILASKPIKHSKQPIITEDEIKSVVTLGEEVGEVEEDERIMIHNIFRFSDLEACQIMTDRTAIFTAPGEYTVEKVAKEVVSRGYSRIPIYENKRDNIVGILYAKDLLNALISGKENATLKELSRPVMFVPETILVDDLLKKFQKERIHMAIVVDEHGGVGGLITIEDLLEEIVGDIMDETDKEQVMIHKTGKKKALVKGQTEVEEVNKVLHLGISEHSDFETISGFILSRMRRIPAPGEELNLGDAIIRITKADNRHIEEVEIEKI
ncbi:MAG: HlyC/CorC family transporter [Desulfatibacillum sp.]|nr:HlyC/CorC family transporter [Desulfatibacillum sp.]